jgi:hypothetical protein
MSLVGMTAARMVRSSAPGAPRVGPSLAAGPAQAKTEDVLTQLIRYTPIEWVGIYVGVISVLPALPDEGETVCDSGFGWRWAIFLIFTGLTPFAVWAVAAAQARAARAGASVPWFEMIVGTIAFAACAIALPLSPLDTLCDWQGWMGTVIGAIVLVVIGLVAKITGKALPRQA